MIKVEGNSLDFKGSGSLLLTEATFAAAAVVTRQAKAIAELNGNSVEETTKEPLRNFTELLAEVVKDIDKHIHETPNAVKLAEDLLFKGGGKDEHYS